MIREKRRQFINFKNKYFAFIKLKFLMRKVVPNENTTISNIFQTFPFFILKLGERMLYNTNF